MFVYVGAPIRYRCGDVCVRLFENSCVHLNLLNLLDARIAGVLFDGAMAKLKGTSNHDCNKTHR